MEAGCFSSIRVTPGMLLQICQGYAFRNRGSPCACSFDTTLLSCMYFKTKRKNKSRSKWGHNWSRYHLLALNTAPDLFFIPGKWIGKEFDPLFLPSGTFVSLSCHFFPHTHQPFCTSSSLPTCENLYPLSLFLVTSLSGIDWVKMCDLFLTYILCCTHWIV